MFPWSNLKYTLKLFMEKLISTSEKCLHWACFLVKVEVEYSFYLSKKAKIMNTDQPRNRINVSSTWVVMHIWTKESPVKKWIEKINKTNTGGEMCHYWIVYGYRSITLNEFFILEFDWWKYHGWAFIVRIPWLNIVYTGLICWPKVKTIMILLHVQMYC